MLFQKERSIRGELVLSKEIINLKNVSKVYSSEAGKQKVLNEINVVVKEGEFIGVVGDSGSGKTTLLNLLGALDIPSSGEISILGKRIDQMTERELCEFRRQNIGFIFQDYNLIEELTVYENIMFSADLKGLKTNKQTVEKLLAALKLGQKKDSFPSQLSGGEKQRVAILRSVLKRPAIILADEPTGNLDEVNTKIVIDLLKKFNKKYGVSILMVTHNTKLTEECDKVITVRNGSLEINS
ncbi:MAG: ABC transporter ATP-binding protein [Lachnospiraceae bacterium]|nr:ABC transporter ATP-binding protein [Lachnospiraceae bacterium]